MGSVAPSLARVNGLDREAAEGDTPGRWDMNHVKRYAPFLAIVLLTETFQ